MDLEGCNRELQWLNTTRRAYTDAVVQLQTCWTECHSHQPILRLTTIITEMAVVSQT